MYLERQRQRDREIERNKEEGRERGGTASTKSWQTSNI